MPEIVEPIAQQIHFRPAPRVAGLPRVRVDNFTIGFSQSGPNRGRVHRANTPPWREKNTTHHHGANHAGMINDPHPKATRTFFVVIWLTPPPTTVGG
jgi:hypothetical protein